MTLSVTAQGPFVLKLQKQVVPVKRGAKTVSHKTAYFGNVSLGYPPQEFSMVMDTGSGHVLVPFEGCKSVPCAKRRRYSSQISQTGLNIDHDGTPVEEEERDQATIAFGTGEVFGQFVSDLVCVSAESRTRSQSKKDVPLGCARVRVVTALEMSEEPFNSFQFDGVLGLGLQPLALTPEFSFFNAISTARGISQPYFSMYLGRRDDEGAEIIFGDYKHERLSGGVRWAPVQKPELGYWQVKIESVFIGKERLRICDSGECRAIVDTGTSSLGVPKSNMIDFQQRLVRKVSKNHTDVDCRKEVGPEIRFTISGGVTLSLSVEDYARPAPFLADVDLVARLKSGAAATSAALSQSAPQHLYCKPQMAPMELPTGKQTFILGEPILRKYISVFDWSVPRVGFAPVSKDWSKPHVIDMPAPSTDVVTV